LGIPAGPLLNAAYMQVALDAGFCMPVYKTVRSRFQSCHPWPNVLSVTPPSDQLNGEEQARVTATPFTAHDYHKPTLSITNSFGVPSAEPETWAKDYCSMGVQHSHGYEPVLSFQTTLSPQSSLWADATIIARLAAMAAADCGTRLFEINLSCPNEGGTPLYKTLDPALEVLTEASRALKANHREARLIAKLGLLSERDTIEFVQATKGILHGVSAINTIPAEIRSPSGESALGSTRPTGGICGHAILKAGLTMTERLHQARRKAGLHADEYAIIGVGGVRSTRDFFEYLNAGADVVHSATGAMWNLNLAAEIAEACKVSFNRRR
jgi:dihydroorotate dehydrogenase (NAD+) catalytic subunit